MSLKLRVASVALLMSLSTAAAVAADCPAKSTQMDDIVAAINAAPGCDAAMTVFGACEFGASGDVQLGPVRLVLDGADLSGREALVKHCDLDYQIASLMYRVCLSVATLWRSPSGAAGPADVAVTTAGGTGRLAGAFVYGAQGSVLLQDDFNDGVNRWTISPLGNAAGWSVLNGVLNYNGGGHTQLYRGDPSWSDYSFEVKIRLTTLNNFPGGIRGRVDVGTGAKQHLAGHRRALQGVRRLVSRGWSLRWLCGGTS